MLIDNEDELFKCPTTENLTIKLLEEQNKMLIREIDTLKRQLEGAHAVVKSFREEIKTLERKMVGEINFRLPLDFPFEKAKRFEIRSTRQTVVQDNLCEIKGHKNAVDFLRKWQMLSMVKLVESGSIPVMFNWSASERSLAMYTNVYSMFPTNENNEAFNTLEKTENWKKLMEFIQ